MYVAARPVPDTRLSATGVCRQQHIVRHSDEMPLTPQHSWDETDTTMNIVVTAPGLTKAKSDLLICDTFVRINAPPYLLQLDLAHAVDDCNGTAVFGTSSLALRLTKVS